MALRDNPYLPLYVQDFLTDEKLAECSAEATGVYIRIMCLMHKSEFYGRILLKQRDKQNESTIKNFASKLAKHLPYSEGVILRSLDELVEDEVLTIDGDFLAQKRMVRDGEISEKRSLSGRKGGNPALNSLTNNENLAYANLQANTESESDIDNDIEDDIKKGGKGGKKPTPKPAPKPLIPFEQVWNLYDKKRGEKSKLETKWNALSRADQQAIVEYIPRYKAAEPNKKYRKDFATFLNNRGWEDEIITDTGSNGTGQNRTAGSTAGGLRQVPGVTSTETTYKDTL